MEKLRSGLTSYYVTGEYSPDFIDDVNMMISKTFSQWSLYEDEEEFCSSCWAKVVKSLKLYDECGGREVGPLSTYLYSVLWNEARRLHSKYKRMAFDDIEKSSHKSQLWVKASGYDDNLLLRDRICVFARNAYKMGVYVNQKDLYRNYLLGFLTPAVKAFMWSHILV